MSMFNYSVDRETMDSVLALMERHRPKAPQQRIKLPGVLQVLPLPAPEPKRYSPISSAQVRRIAQLAARGVDQKQIAIEVGISQGAVSKRLCRMGYRKLRFKTRTAKQKQEQKAA